MKFSMWTRRKSMGRAAGKTSAIEAIHAVEAYYEWNPAATPPREQTRKLLANANRGAAFG
jgi:hypothetical protein